MERHVIINIGRQYGSGGKAVAEQISTALDIPVYDKELLTQAGKESGYGPEFFSRRDEKRSFLKLGGFFGLGRVANVDQSYLSDSKLFQIQSEVIRDIAAKGNAIFIGRASDYILRDMDCLDVFICAPLPARTRRIADRRGITHQQAAAEIARIDKSRREFYNFFTLGNWGEAANYDLCIDSTVLGIKKTAEFIIEFGRSKGLI